MRGRKVFFKPYLVNNLILQILTRIQLKANQWMALPKPIRATHQRPCVRNVREISQAERKQSLKRNNNQAKKKERIVIQTPKDILELLQEFGVQGEQIDFNMLFGEEESILEGIYTQDEIEKYCQQEEKKVVVSKKYYKRPEFEQKTIVSKEQKEKARQLFNAQQILEIHKMKNVFQQKLEKKMNLDRVLKQKISTVIQETSPNADQPATTTNQVKVIKMRKNFKINRKKDNDQ